MYKIGIDLGGTKVEGIVTDENCKELYRKRYPNGKEGGYESVLATIKMLYDDLCSFIKGAPHTLGLGMPGTIAKKTGLVKCCNIPFMNGKNFKEDLNRLLGHNIEIENDANCFALAEATIGAGKGKQVVFGVIIGTGCGGGLVINGKVIRGLGENTGEWGHSVINYDNGPDWGTAPRGIVEAYISGSGIQNQYKLKYNEEKSVPEILADYRAGEEKGAFIIDEFLEHFGLCMGNLIKYIDPDVIVLGGGVSNVDEIYTEGLERTKKYVFNNDLYTPIVKNQFGDSAGVFGAAVLGIV